MQIAAQAITGAIAPRSWNQPWSKASADPNTSSVDADAVADAAAPPPLVPPPASTEYSEPGVTVVYVGGTVVVVAAVLGGSVLPAAATPGRGPAGAPLGAWPQ